MGAEDNTATPKRVPGRKPGPEHLDEVARKMILFVSRQMARDQGLVPADTPLMITDRVF